MDARGRPTETEPLTEARGRTASLEELRAHLYQAPPGYLEGASMNPRMTADEMLMLLSNRRCHPTLLTRVARDSRWAEHHAIRQRVVAHPNTPLTTARALTGKLFWRDLVRLANDVRLHPALRREAEERLSGQLGKLTPGERTALARQAGTALLEELSLCPERRVLAALLENERLRVDDVARIAGGEHTPGAVLERLAEHPAWGRPAAIRRLLALNPRTPIPVVLKLVRDLEVAELAELDGESNLRRIVRIAIDRRRRELEGRRC